MPADLPVSKSTSESPTKAISEGGSFIRRAICSAPEGSGLRGRESCWPRIMAQGTQENIRSMICSVYW
tara:strand:+ start:439 stop:642 length:204 start_codon:yes stop_codon:yes gene_type:complete